MKYKKGKYYSINDSEYSNDYSYLLDLQKKSGYTFFNDKDIQNACDKGCGLLQLYLQNHKLEDKDIKEFEKFKWTISNIRSHFGLEEETIIKFDRFVKAFKEVLYNEKV